MGFFNLGWQEFAILGCFGAMLLGGIIALIVVFSVGGKGGKDE
jgi:hypothetical protein